MEGLSVVPADETEGRSHEARRLAPTVDPFLVLQIAEANKFFTLAGCLFVNRFFHSHAVITYTHQRTIAQVARGWLARHGTVYDGEQYYGQKLLDEGETELTMAKTMMAVNYGCGIADFDGPTRDVQLADINHLMQRINKWRDCQRRKGLLMDKHLKEATVVDLKLSRVAPYMLVRYWLFHAFISDNNVWRGLQSDWRHFLDVMPADADDDDERRYIADPEVSMTVTRSTQLFQLLCDE